MIFLVQVMGKTARQNLDGTWGRMSADSVLKEVGNQKLGTYIDKQQIALVEWVALRPIYEVCDRETECDGGGGGGP